MPEKNPQGEGFVLEKTRNKFNGIGEDGNNRRRQPSNFGFQRHVFFQRHGFIQDLGTAQNRFKKDQRQAAFLSPSVRALQVIVWLDQFEEGRIPCQLLKNMGVARSDQHQ